MARDENNVDGRPGGYKLSGKRKTVRARHIYVEKGDVVFPGVGKLYRIGSTTYSVSHCMREKSLDLAQGLPQSVFHHQL